MLLLDTNVVSELRKTKSGRADHNVVAWARSVSPSMLFLSVIRVPELEQGILGIERRDVVQGALMQGWLEQAALPPSPTGFWRSHLPEPRAEDGAIIATTAWCIEWLCGGDTERG